jgi:hypothetical protein
LDFISDAFVEVQGIEEVKQSIKHAISNFIKNEIEENRRFQAYVEWLIEGRRKHEKKLEDLAWNKKMDEYARMQKVLFRNITKNTYQIF